MSLGGESNGVQSTVHNLESSFVEDGMQLYNPMMPPVSSPPHSYQLSAGYGGVEAPPTASTQPSLNPSVIEPIKKKRGRPRKYVPDGSANPGIMSPPPPAVQSTGGSLSPTGTQAADTAASPKKKSRGRPPGSGRKHQMAGASAVGSAGAGFGFKPHVITIEAGEDVQAKLMSFSQNMSQTICVLSANGAISNVTLRQPSTSGGSVTYEGRFEILSLSGSFLFSEAGGQRSRTGGLTISLAGPDGHVLGGGVAGLLTAAAPVQIIVGSFSIQVQKLQKAVHCEGAAMSQGVGASAAKSPPLFGTLSASSSGGGGPVSPPPPPPQNQHHLETSITSPPPPPPPPPGLSSFPWR